MKRALTLITVISFVSLAIFGFDSSFGFSECIAKATGGGSCPGQTNLLQYINFHLGSISSFFNISIGSQVSIALSLISFVLALGSILISRHIARTSLLRSFAKSSPGPDGTFIPLIRLHLLRSSVFYLRPGPF